MPPSAPGPALRIANKECLVSAGGVFMKAAAEAGVDILPIDSEHNAIFQALGGRPIADVERIILTASGGPFRSWSAERMAAATPAEALKHPNWSMGRKITIDSATLMNKGLEVIEAHHLFGAPPAMLEVLVHPQSVVHGIVAFRDGAMMAGMSVPDMRMPIAHCLSWPGPQCARRPASRPCRTGQSHLRKARSRAVFRLSGLPLTRLKLVDGLPTSSVPPTRWLWRRFWPAGLAFLK